MENNDIHVGAEVMGLDDSENQHTSVIRFVEDKFIRAKNARRADEDRWLKAYRNYRGIYGPDVQFLDTEKSRVFIKVTKTKVLAAYSQVAEVLFANNNFPLSVEPTMLPEGVVDHFHLKLPNAQQPQQPPQKKKTLAERFAGVFGYKNDGKELAPGTSTKQLLGALADDFSDLEDDIQPGPGTTPDTVTFSPAMVAAKKMEKKIKDQLDETGAVKQLRHVAFECALFGTGIMKGPFAVDKEYPNWNEDGAYKPTIKTRPMTDHVSIWDFYPDPDGDNMDDVEFVIQRHKLNRSQLRALKKRPMFRRDSIDTAISLGESYVREYWEDVLDDDSLQDQIQRYDVKEYWGIIPVELLESEGISVPDELSGFEELQANIWFCNGQLLRLVLNPFKPTRIPYYVVPYELNPYSIFGIGVAENMEDTQLLMNGFMRMAVDNAVLSGNLVFEVDETNLVPGQDMKVYPGKVFRRQGGAPGQALFGTKFPNVSQENLQLFDKARQLADESTGLPSFAHGQTGISGVGRTSSGISMLMNAASGATKTVVKNFDDYLLRPLGESFFHFNMQFDYDPECAGDLEIKARGTESLMQTEVRSQRLLQFLQVIQNPQMLPFAKLPYIIREIAKSMELDPDLVVNNMDDAAKMAMVYQKMNPMPAPSAAAAAPPQEATNGAGLPPAKDTSGGGGSNIGVGSAPTPGEQGFSGNMPQ